jgi:hypothetical protein
MRILLLTSLLLLTAFIFIACTDPGLDMASNTADAAKPVSGSVAESYKKLYEAVKSKNTEAIKAQMTTKTQQFAEMVAGKNAKPIEEVFANGFTATTFAETLPPMRDERVNESFGSLEVWNAKDKRWEDLPFIAEDGTWKLAVGDLFAGSFQSPGKGRAQKEAEAANVLNNNSMVPMSNVNVNGNFKSGPRPVTDPKGQPKS